MPAKTTISTIICASCKKYCKKHVEMEIFYHCELDTNELIEEAMKKERNTLRVNEAMIKNKCNEFV